MEQEVREKLYQSIVKDDVKTFGSLCTPEVFSSVFGHFPLLSLVYLYGAKRILSKHFSDLIKERGRVRQPGFAAADTLFRKKAGKTLRHFAGRDVSPLEMLAVLGERGKLRKLYSLYPNATRYLPMIKNIYFTRIGKVVTVKKDKLILPPEPLAFAERKLLFRLAFIFLGIGVALALTTALLSVYFGWGTSAVYLKVRSGDTALSALTKDQPMIIKSDITLAKGVDSYSAKIGGENHVIALSAPFAERFSGEIRDVTFLLTKDFKGDAVILENSGALLNVRVIAEGEWEKGGEYVSALVAVNKGKITSCSVQADLTIGGDQRGNCYLGMIAGKNEGVIQNCLAKGSCTAENVDLAGIVGENLSAGSVHDCTVEMNLTQRTTLQGWNPNVAGICDTNHGVIERCVFSGSISAVVDVLELQTGEDVCSAYAAGIVCTNVGTLFKCTNQGSVTATAHNGGAFAGGIVTFNTVTNDYALLGMIEGCSGLGEVTASSDSYNSTAGGVAAVNNKGATIQFSRQTQRVEALTQGDYYDYTGGIAGQSGGLLKGCFFVGTLPEQDQDSIVGAIVGSYHLYYGGKYNGQDTWYTNIWDNNAFVSDSARTSGAVVSDTSDVFGLRGYDGLRASITYSRYYFENTAGYEKYVSELLDANVKPVTLEELKEMEIYYE
ncbi:MAG TPA: hypothetical protein DHV31_01145 [Clostridiales bacterium]|nr:hypothetical protein [Clostridiales bacterium]